ncbi:hypothetical protein [Desulfonatronovibrio magnus]|uniref:hypothetical protein n=1 Tax=Desulfonatronovibrio magnus TaxID=698827 RepID=UPI0012FC69AF|nr:hypothetical protein [Desulfonatronovibrio magnus]
MSRISKFIFTISLFTLGTTLMLSGLSNAQSRVVASGDSFEVTEDYLKVLEEYYAASGFSTSKDQYLSQAIRFKILAEEAVASGLEPLEVNVEHWGYDSEDPVSLSLINDIGLAEAFLAEKIVNYPVDDKVIISFYRSNPSQFLEGPWGDADMLPLDSALKEAIKMHILESQRGRLAGAIYDELKKKHEVQIYE